MLWAWRRGAGLLRSLPCLRRYWGSFWVTPRLLVIFQEWRGLWSAISLIGPFGLVVAGFALFLPQQAKTGLVPVLTALAGLGIGIVIEVNRPAADPVLGLAAASMCTSLGIWMVAVLTMAMASTRIAPEKMWMIVGTRIAGSWLIATGLLLGGLGLLPPKVPDAATIPMAPPPEFSKTVQP